MEKKQIKRGGRATEGNVTRRIKRFIKFFFLAERASSQKKGDKSRTRA